MEPGTITAWTKLVIWFWTLFPKRTHRVLIVEDSALDVQLLSYLLSRQKVPHDIVTTRESAIALAKQNQYSIALVDIRLPNGESGLDLAQELIRMNGNRRRFNVILTPGLMEDILPWPNGTLVGVLGKPITTESLEDMLVMTRP